MLTWLLLCLRIRFFYIPLLIVFQIVAISPIASQILGDEEIIKTYFLPPSINSIFDIEKSFQINGFKNVIAINWLENINKTTNQSDLAKILPLIRNDLILPSTIPQPLRQVYNDSEFEIAGWLSNNVALEKKKFEVAYFCAYFLHSYYLFQAKNGYLVLNPDYGRSLYINFAQGEIPKEFQELSNEESNNDTMLEFNPEDVNYELTKWIKHVPFGYYGLIPILLLVISFLLRRTNSRNNSEELEIASADKIRDVIESKFGNNIPKEIKNVAKNIAPPFVQDSPPSRTIELNLEHENKNVPLPSVFDTTVNTEKIVKKPLYARAPYGNIFHQLEESLIPFVTQFQLTLNPSNENEAFFTFIENEPDLIDLIQTNLRIFDEICEIVSGNPISSPSDIHVLKPGKAIKEGVYWRVVKKITLR